MAFSGRSQIKPSIVIIYAALYRVYLVYITSAVHLWYHYIHPTHPQCTDIFHMVGSSGQAPFGLRREKAAQCGRIAHPDIETCNGVVHIIDKVCISGPLYPSIRIPYALKATCGYGSSFSRRLVCIYNIRIHIHLLGFFEGVIRA